MDARKIRSRQAILDAFVGLLLEHDYTKILSLAPEVL